MDLLDTFLILSWWGFALDLGLTSYGMIFKASISISRLFLSVPIFIWLLEEFLVTACLCLMLIGKDLDQSYTCETRESNFHLSACRQAITGYFLSGSWHGFLFFTLVSFMAVEIEPAKGTQKIIWRHQCSLISRYSLFKPHNVGGGEKCHAFDMFNLFEVE